MYVPTDWTATICTADGCDKPRTGVFHTWCKSHYQQDLRRRQKERHAVGFGRSCSVDGCDKPHDANGYCGMHRGRLARHGSLELPPRASKVKADKATCSVEGCAKEVKALGWCGSHYSNYLRHGAPVVANMRGPRDEPKLDKFARHLTGDDETGCWLYSGIINEDGYGKFNSGQGRGEVKAHRWLYQELTGRTLTRATQLDHTCEVRHCVRPSHLLEVSQALHNAHTAARKAAPAGQFYKADESPRSLAEVGFAITHKLPMIWNT
ncbi:hypothetical protein ACFVTM_13360 [Arthrobacter sp. NPDC058130]|uniref:hypothetical protein n=1 Tax=Arthrobacter sp. NPDC058130 TaxID=3346353 RepID=UPI0036E99B8E